MLLAHVYRGGVDGFVCARSRNTLRLGVSVLWVARRSPCSKVVPLGARAEGCGSGGYDSGDIIRFSGGGLVFVAAGVYRNADANPTRQPHNCERQLKRGIDAF